MTGRLLAPFWITVLVVVLTGGEVLAQDSTRTAPAPAVRKKPKKKAPPPTRKKGSRVLNDSTKQVYGPKTVLWTTEKSLFYNRNVYVPLDTSYINLHRWTYIQRFNNFYKDLGNMGTALSPIFPTMPSTVGATTGFTSYDLYYDTEEPRYFDTKSPYTQINLVWGGKGRAITKVEFSRNVHSRWNFGFDYRPIFVDRQLQYQKANRQTVSQYYDLYTTYKSKDSKYLVLFNYRRMRHRVVENGGVNTNALTSLGFFDPNAAFYLSLGGSASGGNAVTEYYKSGIHLFQHYQLARPFQVYTITDIHTTANKFSDATSGELNAAPPVNYFHFSQGDSANASDQAILKTFQNEAGIKGNAGPLFYNFYAKLRSYQYENTYQEPKSSVLAYKRTGTEKYVGGRVELQFDSLTQLSGMAEYLLDGHYKLEADWKSPWIDASARSTLAKPGFMQTAYFGSHDSWNNSFSAVASEQLSGFIKVRIGPLFISPGATFTTLSNYIYFKQKVDSTLYQQVLPYQHGVQVAFAPELRFSLQLMKRISLKTQGIYTLLVKNDGNALQIPLLFINSQLAYEGPFFKGNLHVQVGFDAHWQSTYNALGYATAIQQFYVQDARVAMPSPSFLLADVFLNAKIKRGRFFFKYQNLMQAFTKSGYIPTPGYPGTRNLLDFGFIMLLFD